MLKTLPAVFAVDKSYQIMVQLQCEALVSIVGPDLMICGHTHKYGIHKTGGEYDHLGQPCTVVIASEPQKERFIGCGFVIGDGQIEAVFTDSCGDLLSKETLPKLG